MISGVVFDMDGTITKPVLDFAAIRREVGAPKEGPPVLEFFESLAPKEKARAFEILLRHERRAAKIAEFNDGAEQLLDYLKRENLPCGLLTRNGDATTRQVMEKLGLEFSVVVTRDTGVGLKPSAEPLLYIAREWRLKPEQVLMVGDFLYDILMGRRAGCRTAFLTNGQAIPQELDADMVITALDELIPLLTLDRSTQ